MNNKKFYHSVYDSKLYEIFKGDFKSINKIKVAFGIAFMTELKLEDLSEYKEVTASISPEDKKLINSIINPHEQNLWKERTGGSCIM